MKNKYFLEFAAIFAIAYLLAGFVYWDLDPRTWGPFVRFMFVLVAIVFYCGVSENSKNPNKDEN